MAKTRYRELSTLFFETRQIIRQKLPKSGASDPNAWLRCETMRYIRTAGAPSMQEIANFLRIAAPSATSLIAHLEKEGFAKRERLEEDKRIVRVLLTKKGKRELIAYDRRTERTLAAVFGVLSQKKIGELRGILHELKEMHE